MCKALKTLWPLEEAKKRFSDVTDASTAAIGLVLDFVSLTGSPNGMVCAILRANMRVDWHAFTWVFHVSIIISNGKGLELILLYFLLLTASDAPARTSLWSQTGSTMSDKLATIKAWFQECETEHPECAPQELALPTRLIYIGAANDEMRLVDVREETKDKIKFASLSHCWGGCTPLKTTKENLQDFRHRIPSESFPRTFQEAIQICRSVGISYIWIDSLCIVQNDAEDWRHEAARMKDVYAGNVLTIAASEAANGSEGCFPERPDINKRRRPPLQFETMNPESQEPIFVRIYERDVRERTGDTPLSERGWALQEAILSHRNLYCVQPEMHWQCSRVHRIEEGISFQRDKTGTEGKEPLPAVFSTFQHRSWHAWMHDYSHRKFTIPRDRLSALAGVVDHFAEKTGYTHLLGCWQESLLADLLWMRSGEMGGKLAFELPGIPSWSWIAKGGVMFDFWENGSPGANVTDHTIVVRAEVEWHDTPLVSDVKRTELVLEGPIKDFRLRISPLATRHNPPYWDVGDEVLDQSERPIPWGCAGQLDVHGDQVSEDYTCLLMRSSNSRGSTIPRETFLMLKRVEGGSDDVYKRVGIGIFNGRNKIMGQFEDAAKRRVSIV